MSKEKRCSATVDVHEGDDHECVLPARHEGVHQAADGNAWANVADLEAQS